MDPREIRITGHTYDLPLERIAQHPLADRDASKLLVLRDGVIEDNVFRELPSLLPSGTLLVLNDTRVVKARVLFRKDTGALIEVMLMEPEGGAPMERALAEHGQSIWRCMVGNAKRWKGETLVRASGPDELKAEALDVEDGIYRIRFSWSSDRSFAEVLAVHGAMPLPPYMKREAEPEDDGRYNTVFAEHEGSVAAPTASLHFTPQLLNTLTGRGIDRTEVTLHVGAGTFLPVKSERMGDHPMHAEQVHIPRRTVEQLLERVGHGPIVPVGTTALRTIESLYWFGADLLVDPTLQKMDIDQWRPYMDQERPSVQAALQAVLTWIDRNNSGDVNGRTRLLIAPGYRFALADGLVTNFHQPGSTLLLLVSAFVGEAWREIYQHALAHDYRFLSYGDASLLWRRR